MANAINALRIRAQLRKDDYAAPYPLGGDSWIFDNFDGQQRIIVSHDPITDPGVDWVHASISHQPSRILPAPVRATRRQSALPDFTQGSGSI